MLTRNQFDEPITCPSGHHIEKRMTIMNKLVWDKKDKIWTSLTAETGETQYYCKKCYKRIE